MVVPGNKKALVSASSTPNIQPPSTSVSSWYNSKHLDDSDNEDIINSSFDLGLAGASTPLRSQPSNNENNAISFLSPIAKLNNLHLESEIGNNEEEYDDYEDNDDNDISLGNQTITNETESEVEFQEDSDREVEDESPKYINLRKRQHVDSPSDMVITPKNVSGPDSKSDMTICINTTTSSGGNFKLSFSQSDSTPCPIQPRKKLKFKNLTSSETTPSQQAKNRKKKNILNLSSSVKTSASSIINKLSNIHNNSLDNENIEDKSGSSSPVTLNTTVFSNIHNQQSTPISQSTPANSRAPSPLVETEDYGQSVNGYRFVRPVINSTHNYYSYQTPNNKPLKSKDLRSSYTKNDFYSSTTPLKNGTYQIVGEFPITSAGLMDESDSNIHIGDKRINDPYLNGKLTEEEQDDLNEEFSLVIRKEYFETVKLPLLQCFESTPFSKAEILDLINDNESIFNFYSFIKLPNEKLVDLIKKERLKWHPDKWYSKMNDSSLDLDKEIIDNLSQVLNSVIEELS